MNTDYPDEINRMSTFKYLQINLISIGQIIGTMLKAVHVFDIEIN